MKIVIRWKSPTLRVAVYVVALAVLAVAGLTNYQFVYQAY